MGACPARHYLLFTFGPRPNPMALSARPSLSKGASGMFQRFASTAVVIGSLVVASIPAGFARDHGGGSSAGHSFSGRSASPSGRSYSGGSSHYSAPRGYSGGSHYEGSRNFVTPRGYEGSRGYL